MQFEKLFTLLFWGMLISVLSTGCDEGAAIPEPELSILPLEAGNSWTYVVEKYADSYLYDTDTIFVSIGEDTVISGYECNKYQRSDIPDVEFYYTNLDDGLYEVARYDVDIDTLYYYSPALLVFEYPADEDDVFESYGISTRVLSLDTTISTPVGSFDCVEYMNTQSPHNVHYFFAPGIGQIGVEKWEYGEWLFERRLLIDFTLVEE